MLASGGPHATDAARTAVDCLATWPLERGLDLWAWVSTRRVLDAAALDRAVERRRCWDGTAQLRQLADVVLTDRPHAVLAEIRAALSQGS